MLVLEAASRGRLWLLKCLLHIGFRVNAKERESGVTALQSAAYKGHLEIVEALLQHGADINIVTNIGQTALYSAAVKGHVEVVSLLLQKGANINQCDNEGGTPLIAAAQEGHLEVVRRLVREGMDINACTNEGWTALHKAAYRGRKEMVQFLVEEGGADLLLKDEKGCTAARLASQNGHIDIVVYLVQEPTSGNVLDPGLLMSAAEFGRLAMTQKLTCSLGANSDHRDPSSGLNAEDLAHMKGQSDIAWYLNKSTEGRNRQSGCRPEMESCKCHYGGLSWKEMRRGKDESCIVHSNLDAGVYDLHFQDERGMTLLHGAVKKNQLDVISLLLERGALASALTHDGVTPLALAREEGLREAGAKIKAHLKKFSKNEFKSSSDKSRYHTVMLSLIQYCISLSSRHKEDDTKAEKEQQKVLKNISWLLSLGVPTEPPGNYHTHALHLAITSNCKPILTLLLAAGAPLYATYNGLGPVEVAWLSPDVTTWVAVTVTRAVINRLQSERTKLRNCDATDDALRKGIEHLIRQLDGQKPWLAKFTCQDEYDLNALLGAACKQGVTLTAWWVWRAGGCCLFQDRADGRTALHIALDGKHFDTAKALVQYMEANAFLPDKKGRLPIYIFPRQKRYEVIKGSMVNEYRVLDGVLQRAIDSRQKRKAKETILLFLTLFLIWKHFQFQPTDADNWNKFFIGVISILHTFDANRDATEDWILQLNEQLKKIPVDAQYHNSSKHQMRDYGNAGESRDEMDGFLQELDSYYTDDESNSLDILLDLLEPLVKTFLTSDQTLFPPSGSSREINESYINALLKKGLMKCSGMKLPIFLHLLISFVKVSATLITDPITETFALHNAARNGNVSAALYLLKNGAQASAVDRYGRTPSHLAYMHGHKDLGYLLHTQPEIVSRNGLTPTRLWEAYKQYLRMYGLEWKEMTRPEFADCNNSEDLIKLHLQPLKVKWSKQGVRESVEEAKVDYTNGESFAVQSAIKSLLGRLVLAVGNLDYRFEGELIFVGSSEDDVRLISPDEYDCNVVFKNFSAYPDGGCQIALKDSGACKDLDIYENKSIIVSTQRSDLKDLFEERNLLVTFYDLLKKCLQELSMEDSRLSVTLPSMKLTQVGVGLSFAWNGEEFPLLLIDVDVVPTIKAPWQPEMEKSSLLPDIEEVYLNIVGRNEWRYSFARAEKRVMEGLSNDEKLVFLASKLVIASLKTEKWMPKEIKGQFQYWDGHKMKIPLPKGFILKNSFFLEKEKVTDPELWKEDFLLERMRSIFRRMCHEMERGNKTIFVPGRVAEYFSPPKQVQCVGFGAPEILAFLQDWQRSSELRQICSTEDFHEE